MKLALFDFDGTLFRKDTLPYLGQEWKRQGLPLGRLIKTYMKIMPLLLQYRTKTMTPETFKYHAVQKFHTIFYGMTEPEVDLFFLRAYSRLRQYYHPLVLQEIKKARREGFHTVLLSGAYRHLLQHAASDLGINTVLAMDIYFRDGLVDPDRPLPFILGPSKYQLLMDAFGEQNIDWSQSRSYADSCSDVPVLEIVGYPMVVNPEPELLEYAYRQKWPLLT